MIAGFELFSHWRFILIGIPIVIGMGGCVASDEPTLAEWKSVPVGVRELPQTPARAERNALLVEQLPRTQVAIGSGNLVGSRKPVQPRIGSDDANGITLNLVNLPIAQAAKVVLGDILSANYIIHPKVEGKITLHTSRPTSKAAIIEMFENALRSSNTALVRNGTNFRIVPLEDAASAGGSPRLAGASPSSAQAGEGIEVVQLRYVSAAEMKRLLEPIAPRGSLLTADNSRNILALAGSPQEIGALKETISTFDIDTMRGMSFAIVPVRSNDPDALADDVRNIMGLDRDGPMNGMVRLIGNKRMQAVLVITSQPRYIARAEAWIRKLDGRARGSEKQFYTYKVQNRPARELVTVLNAMFAASSTPLRQTPSVAPRATPVTVQTGSVTAGVQMQGGLSAAPARDQSPFGTLGNTSNPSTSSRDLNNSPQLPAAVELGTTSGNSEEARSRVAVDESKNTIVFMATPLEHQRIMRVVEQLDVLPNQVLIEATIAEVTLNDDMKFGVRWYLQQRASRLTLTDDVAGAVGSVFPGFSYLLKGANAQFTLNALNSVTNVNVISSPSLTVLDNKTATLQVGDQVPITTQSAVSVGGIGAPIVNSVTYRDTGVILSITPHINESGRVLLDIEQEVSSVSATTSSSINSPTIQQRRVRTSVVLNDSEALVLGGLQQDRRTRGNDQVPVLGEIPLIGAAFRERNNRVAKTELIILITPKVIRSLTEAAAVTEEFRRKLGNMRTRPQTPAKQMERTIKRIFE